jgi:hypothetical protein
MVVSGLIIARHGENSIIYDSLDCLLTMDAAAGALATYLSYSHLLLLPLLLSSDFRFLSIALLVSKISLQYL